MKSKLFGLLEKSKTATELAGDYGKRLETSINYKVIHQLEEKIADKEMKVIHLEDFSLDTNLNRGKVRMTKEEIEERLIKIIDLRVEIDLDKQELALKQKVFTEYFGTKKED